MKAIWVSAKKIVKARDFAKILWVGILLFDLSVIGLVAMVIVQNRQLAFEKATAIADNYSRTLEENFIGFIRKIDVTLLTAAEEVARQNAGGGINEKEMDSFLIRQDAHIPEARGLRVIDVQGTIRYAVNGVNTRGANLSDRPYFIRARDDPNAGLVFSEPVMGRASNVPVITLSRRVDNPDGSFAGEVNAAIGINQLFDKLAVLELGSKGIAALWSHTQLIVRYAKDEAVGARTGTPIPSPQLRGLIDSGNKAGFYHSVTRLDNVERINQFRQVADYPLYIVVGLADEDFLVEWRRDSFRIGALAGLLVVGTVIFGWLAHLSWRQGEEMQLALQAEKTRFHSFAYYDTLTKLPNRRSVLERLSQALAQAKRFNRSLAVMFMDLDCFKEINDTYGHDVGDELLTVVADRLSACVRSVDTVSRQGGDEFVIILTEISQAEDATLVAEKIISVMKPPVLVREHELQVTISIGIAVYPIDGIDEPLDLMKKADIAMYEVKKRGRNGFRFYR